VFVRISRVNVETAIHIAHTRDHALCKVLCCIAFHTVSLLTPHSNYLLFQDFLCTLGMRRARFPLRQVVTGPYPLLLEPPPPQRLIIGLGFSHQRIDPGGGGFGPTI
jgi:hypothetical protein